MGCNEVEDSIIGKGTRYLKSSTAFFFGELKLNSYHGFFLIIFMLDGS